MRVFHTESLSERDFDQILAILRTGDVIGFPTDTAYGLAADPFNDQAVAKIFNIKGRPESKPVLLLVDSVSMTERITLWNSQFQAIARSFWPGPLTLVLPAVPSLPARVTAGSGTVGVRWPVAHFATELVGRFGQPVTATSANRSGQQTCVTAAEVQTQLGESLEFIVDGGHLPARSGSTVLDLTCDPPEILREGPVSFETLHAFFGGRLRRRLE